MAAGINAENYSTGILIINAIHSQFNDNGITNEGTVSGTAAGLSVNNLSTGTLIVNNLQGSSFSNNGTYGIYGVGSSSGNTRINDTNVIFSGAPQLDTNQTNNDNIIWIN